MPTPLSNTTVQRGGATAARWTRESFAKPSVAGTGHGVEIAFSFPAAGGGTTDVRLLVGRGDFPALFEVPTDHRG